MARLIKTKFKYISKKMLAIFMITVVVTVCVVWQIGNQTFNATGTNFVDAANADHWGRSDLRAFLNPNLIDGEQKNYLVDSTSNESSDKSGYEEYFTESELELIRSGIGYTTETKNSATNVMEKTKDRYWLPSIDSNGRLYWGTEDVSDESTETFINNDTSNSILNKKNYYIPGSYTYSDSDVSWSRSSKDGRVMTTNGLKLVNETGGISPILTISKSKFDYASVACGSNIVKNNSGRLAIEDYTNRMDIAMHLKKSNADFEKISDIEKIEKNDNSLNINFYNSEEGRVGSYIVVCIYNERDAYLYSRRCDSDSKQVTINTEESELGNYNVDVWIEKEADGTVSEIGQVYIDPDNRSFNAKRKLIASKDELYASWNLTGEKNSGFNQKIYLGEDGGKLIPFWICGQIGDDGKIITNGSYLVLYQARTISSDKNYNENTEKYTATSDMGGKSVLPTLTIGDESKNVITCYAGYESSPDDILKYTNGAEGETPSQYTWYYYRLDKDDGAETTATEWMNGFPKEVGKYKVKVAVDATDNNAAVESKLVTFEIVPKLMGINVENSQQSYIVNQAFDSKTLKVTAIFSDESSNIVEDILITDSEGNTVADDYKFVESKDYTLTVRYMQTTDIGVISETANVTIKVIDKMLNSISAVTRGELKCIEGKELDTSRIIVTGEYNDGTRAIIYKDDKKTEAAVGDIQLSPKKFDYSDGETQQVIIKYSESGISKFCDLPVTVEKKKLSNIKVVHNPVKMIYIQGENFDPTGLSVKAVYNNGDERVLEKEEYSYSPEKFDNADATPTKTNITITYTGSEKVADFLTDVINDIIVNPPQVTDIEVDTTQGWCNTYVSGQEFSTENLIVNAVYNNGNKRQLSPKSEENQDGYEHPKTLTFGVQKCDITYTTTNPVTGKEETFIKLVDVQVSKISFDSISIKSGPDKMNYIEGQTFDPTGLVVTAKLSDPMAGAGTDSIDIESFEDGFWSFEPNILVKGTTSVTVKYNLGSKPTANIDGITVVEKKLDSINIKNQPNNIRYAVGSKFNPDGLSIVAKYNDDSRKEVEYSDSIIDAQFVFFPEQLDFKSEGNDVTSQTVKVSYTDVYGLASTNITVYKIPKVPSKLEVLNTSSNKTNYTEGENFDPVGLRLKVTYTDGEEKEITVTGLKDLETYNLEYNPTGQLSSNDKEVIVEYTEDERSVEGQDIGSLTVKAAQPITVEQKKLDRIEVTTEPKISYIEGETFNSDGMVVTKYYNNGTSDVTTDYTLTYEDGTPVEGELTLEDGRATKKTIKVVLNDDSGKTTTFVVWVAVKTPKDITINHDPETKYVVGQSFDPTGLKFTVTYDNGTDEIIEVTNNSNFAPGLSFVVDTPLTINSNSAIIQFEKNGERVEKTLTINVKEKKLDYIYISKRPDKILYIEGETFNPAGIVVKSRYNDGEEVELENSQYTYSAEPLQWNGTAEQDIEIAYTDDQTKTVHQTITVVQKTITGLEVKKVPNKTSYFVGEKIDPAGMQINAIFNNGDVITVYGEGAEDIGGELIIPDNMLLYGDTEVMISYIYNGMIVVTKQDIIVNNIALDSITIVTPPTKLEYVEEEFFDTEGMVVMAKYNNGFEKQVENSSLAVSPNPLTTDTKSAEIYYTSGNITKVAKQDIVVKAIDDVYKQSTLQDEMKQALISGKFTDGAELVITKIEDNYGLYKEMYEKLTQKLDVALLYDVSIVGGNYHGSMRLTFVVGEAFDGRYITIVHKLASGEKELLSGIVRDGKVTVTVNELSPFMLALDSEDNNNGGSDGENNSNGSGSGSGDGTGGTSANNDGSTSENGVSGSSIFNTGDNSLTVILGLIIILSVCVVIILILRKKK